MRAVLIVLSIAFATSAMFAALMTTKQVSSNSNIAAPRTVELVGVAGRYEATIAMLIDAVEPSVI